MQAEYQGRIEEARRLFQQAWEARQDDYDACVAAHYVARSQEQPEDVLRWNQIAIDHASRVEDDRVQAFYPSLYLNLGWSYESLGDPHKALENYNEAKRRLEDLPASPYRDMVAGGIANGIQRVSGAVGPGPAPNSFTA